jgi:CheY-like chemotaxis protein
VAKAKPHEKRNLTTGDIAKLCGVNFRTVIRWIQRGHLKAFQLPGRGDNRVLVSDFLTFLRDNDMPIPEEFQRGMRTVLIVEADEKAAKSMERSLKKVGFQTAIAADGFEAGSLANSLQPGLITLDPEAPGLGGVEVVRAIRSNPVLSTTKILLVSGMTRDQLEEAVAAGADGYLAKPFKGPQLTKAVGDLVGMAPLIA